MGNIDRAVRSRRGGLRLDRSRTAHGRHDVITRFHFSHVWANCFNLSKTLVTDDQKIVSRRRLAVLGGVDLFVRAIDADAQHAHQHAASIRDVADFRRRQFG